MKKLLILLIVILIAGCSDPTITEIQDIVIVPEKTPEIVGDWTRLNRIWHIYDTGDFLYSSYPEEVIINDGWFELTDDTIYLEDRFTGDNALYVYEIFHNIPESGAKTLRWGTVEDPDMLGDWIKVD